MAQDTFSTSMHDSTKDAEDCLSWAIAQGARVSGVAIAHLSGRGTSLVASGPGTSRYIHIPPSILLNLKNITAFASDTPAFQEICQEWSARVPMTARRAIVLLMAYSQRHSSPWTPYLASLPNCVDSPIFWTDDERKLLTGTSVAGVAEDKIGFMTAWLSYQQRQDYASDFTRSLTLRELMHYEMLVDSRALLSDEQDSCMVPVIDFANHSSIRSRQVEGHQNAVWETDSAGFHLYVSDHLPMNQEVLFSYGKRGNGELLIKYGFTESCQVETGSRSVTIEIPLDTDSEFLTRFGEPSFKISPDVGDQLLMDDESSFIWLCCLLRDSGVNFEEQKYKGSKFNSKNILTILRQQPSQDWERLRRRAFTIALTCLQHQIMDLEETENDPILRDIAEKIDETRLAMIDGVRDSERRTLESSITRLEAQLSSTSSEAY